MDIHILRDGKQTGPFSEETVQVLLKQGSILINDLAWQPGMPEWLPLHAVLYPAAQPTSPSARHTSHPIPSVAAAAPGLSPAPVVAGETKLTSASATAVSPGEPATPRQKAFLTYMGTPFKADLTKEQAALLVNDAMENGKNGGKLKRWDDERLRLYPDLFAEEIKAKRENRSQHFLEACQGEGAEFFDGVTKAHTQVLVGYLDVRFPNWDKEERSAKYDYLFPAISEKFPQLLTKNAKGRFKYPEGPRVAAELVRQPVAVRARSSRSFFGAVVRGVIFGGIVLGLIIAAVKYGRGEWRLPFDLPVDSGHGKSAPTAGNEKKSPGAPEKGAASGETLASQGSTPAPVTASATPVPRSSGTTRPSATPASPSIAATNPGTQPDSATPTPPAPGTSALPPTVSLFDSPPPPPTGTPSPTVPAATATPAPQVLMGRINKPTLVPLKFGTSTIRAGTPVQVIGVEGTSVRIKFGPDVVPVPVGNVDLPESVNPPSATPNQ